MKYLENQASKDKNILLFSPQKCLTLKTTLTLHTHTSAGPRQHKKKYFLKLSLKCIHVTNMINLKEKIKAIQEKYKKEDEEYCNNGYGEAEYQSLGFLDLDEYNDVSDETDEKFKHIYDNLLPCKTELYNLEEELRILKRKIKTPKELIEQEKRVNISCDYPVIDNKIFDIAKDSTKHINKDSFKANEDDIKHMVCDSEGRNYRVHIPATVLDLDNMDDDFVMNNDTVICKVF